jgi:hypothetical protein
MLTLFLLDFFLAPEGRHLPQKRRVVLDPLMACDLLE